jgi:hypothetical protein
MTQSQPQFQTGDEVRCIQAQSNSSGKEFDLNYGQVYTVASVRPSGSIELVGVRNGGVFPPAFVTTRFELARRAAVVAAANEGIERFLSAIDAACFPPSPSPDFGYAVPTEDFAVDQIVRLTVGHGFFDKGDTGTVYDIGNGYVSVKFESGSMGVFPSYTLEQVKGSFRWTLLGGFLSTDAFDTEQAAADDAEDNGYRRFSVVKVVPVADYEVETVTSLVRSAA